jgi:hypothetical protein
MTSILTIKDLAFDQELDRKARIDVRGGTNNINVHSMPTQTAQNESYSSNTLETTGYDWSKFMSGFLP